MHKGFDQELPSGTTRSHHNPVHDCAVL